MARPRTITDARLLDALGQVIASRGPGFTVADVAAQAGVSVGTVAQRFGSKHGLLVALSEAAIAQIPDLVRSASTVLQALLNVYSGLDDPATAPHNLAQLAADLADPELRGLLGRFYSTLADELTPLLIPLQGAPPQAARLLVALTNGTAVDWSINPVGRLADRLTDDIGAVLNGWRTA
ncbi:TetR/AcrR family transcriptional regulator [Actinocrispum sp. NPDC049592]|uniref:TetR/AcrR family transcriptional regulator n=1 Tax=Actinocrispum sp. NPDC049592 TaxID=3154835 RepID=UPI0034239925